MTATNRRNVKRQTKQDRRVAVDPQRRARRVRLLARFAGLYLVFMAAFLGWQSAWGWMESQRWFDLRTIDVVGFDKVSEEEILIYSQLMKGTPIFSIDTARTQALVEAHPWVKSAPVSRRLPDALVIEVTEYVPVGVVMLDKLFFVDADGEPFKVAPEDAAGEFIVIEGLTRADFDGMEIGAAKVRQALEVIAHYRAHEMGGLAPLRAIAHRYNGLTLSVGSLPTELVLGEGNLEELFQRAAKLWRYLARQGQVAETMHLDNRNEPERVTVRLKQPAAETVSDRGTPIKSGG